MWHSPRCKFGAIRTVLNVRYGSLWTAHRARTMGRPYVTDLGTINNGSCPLCLAPLDSAGHLLGECSHRDIKSMHIVRYNKAVGLIQDAIASSPLGGSYMVMDACGRDATPDTVAATRLPPWLLPTMPAHAWDRL